jgi:hypothetical protein
LKRLINYRRVSKRKEEANSIDQERLKKKNAIERFYLDRIVNGYFQDMKSKKYPIGSPNVSSNKEIR